jgi:predicted dehydrogenase
LAELATLPRLGFLGVGWIGRHRMEAVARAGVATVAAVADASAATAYEAATAVGCEMTLDSLDALLELDLDGIVIATPTALHADQARRALETGHAVFCQKPLGRTAPECRELVELARISDLCLDVDMSYRHLTAVDAVAERLAAGTIGRVHAVELTFHNAYGPDKPWVRDAELAGGGALIDLGCHLLDLAVGFLGELRVEALQSDLLAGGRPLSGDPAAVEDLALAQLRLADGRVIRLACSWWLPAGCDAVIEITLLGEGRALRVANVDGSFYDFEALLLDGTRTERLVGPPDDWGGRGISAWASGLADGCGFDPEVERVVQVAELIDRIYLGRQ